MNQQLEKQSYAGVVCRSCRQPIPLPAIVVSMESEIESDGQSLQESSRGRVFSLRCRACDKEMPYRTKDVTEFEGTPRPRVSPARRKAPHGGAGEGFSRAASA